MLKCVAAVAALLTAVPGPKPAAELECLPHSGRLIKTPRHRAGSGHRTGCGSPPLRRQTRAWASSSRWTD